MTDLLLQVVSKLDELQIPYMVSGSLAMGFYATQRYTRDIDILIELKKEDAEKFVKLFEADFYCYLPSVLDSLKHQILFNFIDHKTGFKIDFIPLKDTEFEQIKFASRQLVAINTEGAKVWAISPENLVLSKLTWIQSLVSEVQLLDLENLLRIDELDRDYIRDWIVKLKLQTYHLTI